jgi:hypothetical protein
MRRHPALLLAAALALAAPAAARADRRFYGETYNAATAPRGALDVELWSTLHRAPRDGGVDLWRHQLELETGLTDRWDVALYNVATQEKGGSLRYEAAKVETRYRLADPGAWVVDPILYLEVKKEFVADAPWAIEEKVILGKDAGPLNVSLNLSAEQEFPRGGGHELEWGWAAGTSYEVHPTVRVGGEAFGDLTRISVPGERATEHHAWAGPAVSIAVARTWLVLAAGFALNDESEAVRLRAVLAFQF